MVSPSAWMAPTPTQGRLWAAFAMVVPGTKGAIRGCLRTWASRRNLWLNSSTHQAASDIKATWVPGEPYLFLMLHFKLVFEAQISQQKRNWRASASLSLTVSDTSTAIFSHRPYQPNRTWVHITAASSAVRSNLSFLPPHLWEAAAIPSSPWSSFVIWFSLQPSTAHKQLGQEGLTSNSLTPDHTKSYQSSSMLLLLLLICSVKGEKSPTQTNQRLKTR